MNTSPKPGLCRSCTKGERPFGEAACYPPFTAACCNAAWIFSWDAGSARSRGAVAARCMGAATRKMSTAMLSARVKMSALRMFRPEAANEPAIRANRPLRSHVQTRHSVWPRSGCGFHEMAGARAAEHWSC